MTPKPVSQCCGEELKVISGNEGTSYYECSACRLPADPKPVSLCCGAETYIPPKSFSRRFICSECHMIQDEKPQMKEEIICSCGRRNCENYKPDEKPCHTDLHPLSNIYGLVRKECPVCGKGYYEDPKVSQELEKLNG